MDFQEIAELAQEIYKFCLSDLGITSESAAQYAQESFTLARIFLEEEKRQRTNFYQLDENDDF